MGDLTRTVIAGLALLHALALWGQSDTYRPVPNWRLGDKREVKTQVESRIVMDSLTIQTTSSSRFTLEVTSARKDGYVLAVRSIDMEMPSMDMGEAHAAVVDSVNRIMGAMVAAAIKPFSEYVFRYQVDRTGTALNLIAGKNDKRDLTEAMQRATADVISSLSEGFGKPEREIPQDTIAHLVDSLYEALLQVQVNDMNSFLQIYRTDFPVKGSLRQPVRIEDVQAPLRPDLPILPGVMEVGLDKNDDAELIGRTITTYDRDALFAYMQQLQGSADIPAEELFMDEECVERFDKRTGWLTRSTTALRFRMGLLHMNLKVTTVLQPIR